MYDMGHSDEWPCFSGEIRKGILVLKILAGDLLWKRDLLLGM